MREFVNGAARSLSDEITPAFIEFCRNGLGIEVDDDEFKIDDVAKDCMGEFVKENLGHRALLDDLAGNYAVYRPRQENGQIDTERSRYCRWSAEIRPNGPGGAYSLLLEIQEQRWEGDLVCNGKHLYYVGCSEDLTNLASIILTPIDGKYKDGVLVGMLLTKVDYTDSTHNLHQLAIGRAVALARLGARHKSREQRATRWLDQQIRDRRTDEAIGAGFAIELSQSRWVAPGAER